MADRSEAAVADTAPRGPVVREPGPAPVPPRAGWLVPAVLVVIVSFGLLALHPLGLTYLGTVGMVGLFLLGAGLGVGGAGFTGVALAEQRRGEAEEAAEDAELGRRFAICG